MLPTVELASTYNEETLTCAQLVERKREREKEEGKGNATMTDN